MSGAPDRFLTAEVKGADWGYLAEVKTAALALARRIPISLVRPGVAGAFAPMLCPV